jgi:hypothetical protein
VCVFSAFRLYLHAHTYIHTHTHTMQRRTASESLGSKRTWWRECGSTTAANHNKRMTSSSAGCGLRAPASHQESAVANHNKRMTSSSPGWGLQSHIQTRCTRNLCIIKLLQREGSSIAPRKCSSKPQWAHDKQLSRLSTEASQSEHVPAICT